MARYTGELHTLVDSGEKNPWNLAEARKTLREGNRRYMERHKAPPKPGTLFTTETVESPAWEYGPQWPLAAILCCADSRASPDIVFSQDHGTLFVVRAAGNTVDEKTVANLAYALHELQVPLVVVMGHEQCGAVKAALADGGSGSTPDRYMPFVEPILRAVKPGSDPKREADWKASIIQNIGLTAADIVRHPHLAVGGKPPVVDMAYYHFDSGEAEFFP